MIYAVVKGQIKRDGTIYGVGDRLEMSATEAVGLLKHGVIKQVSGEEARPSLKKRDLASHESLRTIPLAYLKGIRKESLAHAAAKEFMYPKHEVAIMPLDKLTALILYEREQVSKPIALRRVPDQFCKEK